MENTCFLFALLILSFNFVSPTIINSTTDKQVLLSFKNSIKFTSNWSEETPVCDWIGVSCGVKHPNRVTALNLSGFGLAGTLSPHLGNLSFLRFLDISSNNFTGFLPLQLSNLHRLKVMDVGVNSFMGEIPPWLGGLSKLQQLYMHNNRFSGTIPPTLFNNSALQVLRLNNNLLSGNIPEEIGNASSLEILYMSDNQLSGTIPHDIFNVVSMRARPNLKTLALSANQLSGEIPSNIWKCAHLEILSLSLNHFRGNIPNEIGRLSMLRELYLGGNDFRGGIPIEIGNLSRLQILYLGESALSGSIPSSIFNISSLTSLSFYDNKLSGELPQEVGTLPRLQFFSVLKNSLSGPIPYSIFNISSLKYLELANNEFSGNLPSDMGNLLFNLERLQLGGNRLIGTIPTSIANASKLNYLTIELNYFSGLVPDFGKLRLLQRLYIWGNNLSGAEFPTQELTFLSSLTNCRYLVSLDMSDNPLNGILPSSIGNFSNSLLYIHADINNIEGTIPSDIGNLSGLIILSMFENHLTGFVPPQIGKLEQLQELILDNNQLLGSIPTDICGLSHLGALSLESNMLVGQIPTCLGEVKSLRYIFLGSNQLNSTLPSNIWSLTDLIAISLFSNNFIGRLSYELGHFKTLNFLDMSYNQFSGDIPSTIGSCQLLEFLNLSNNRFSGIIPESLGNIKILSLVDLSNNSLSGLLPKSLTKIQSLLDFNVSYNRLEGEIPDEGCFINFTALSFANNSALCGPSRFQVPPCPENHTGSRMKSVVQHMKYIALPLVLVVTFVTIFCVLSRRKNQENVPSPTANILQGIEWRRISYIELERGTSSFSEANLLGRGGFASVFLATLSDGLKVAAKVFNLQLETAAQSFDTESELLSTIRHRNIVHVIGCCSNLEFKALILEYMPNGSLEKWLYSHENYLDLVQRVKIAIDVALALEYLHHGYTFPVVHCDIKPGNVLLDEDMTARVGDFGIAKLFENGEEVIQTKTLAAIGYAAPEYGYEGKVSTKGDVYSYGILLLEMLTRKKPTDDMFRGEMSLKEWVSEALQENLITKIVEPRLLSREDGHFPAKEQCVASIFGLAMKCIPISPNDRINMIEAVGILQKINIKFLASITRPRRYANSISGY